MASFVYKPPPGAAPPDGPGPARQPPRPAVPVAVARRRVHAGAALVAPTTQQGRHLLVQKLLAEALDPLADETLQVLPANPCQAGRLRGRLAHAAYAFPRQALPGT